MNIKRPSLGTRILFTLTREIRDTKKTVTRKLVGTVVEVKNTGSGKYLITFEYDTIERVFPKNIQYDWITNGYFPSKTEFPHKKISYRVSFLASS